MAQTVSPQSLTAEARVRTRLVSLGFLDTVALGQVFLRGIPFTPVSIISSWLRIRISTRDEH
jgi:hypothetical protein